MNIIHTSSAPAAIGSYSQAVQVPNNGSTVYISGQIPLDPATMELVSDDIELQIHQAFKNLIAICKAAGGTSSNFVKLTIFMLDLSHFALVNSIMSEYFNDPMPARVAVEVKGLPKGAQFEVDGTMHLN